MKNLLLLVLSMVAATREATAQEDAQCVRERAAMVETIRAYARSDASVLGQQGLSERSLRPWGKRNAISSSPSLSDPAPSHTRTGRFRSALARPYRSRSSWP